MKTIIILPTYNEAENIETMVRKVFDQLPDARAMIVDDNSPDGTGKIADNLIQSYPNQVLVLHRNKKEGLGKAYLDAFKAVLNLDADQIIQMDADFSHPPTLLPKLILGLQNHDFVLGSRYIEGGKIKNWSAKRRLLSRAGNVYARTVLNLPFRDLTGGYKAFNRSVIEHLVKCPINSSGYCFQIETTVRALAAGFTCTEIPFTFTERTKGVSKLSEKVIWEALIRTFRLRRVLNKSLTKPVPKTLL